MTEGRLAENAGQTAQFVPCAKVSEVPEGSMIGLTIEERQILVGHVGGEFYAMDAVCSHLSGYLPRGHMEENIVTCPAHGAQFDLTTGRVVKNVGMTIKMATHRQAEDLTTYGVKIVGDEILVAIRH